MLLCLLLFIQIVLVFCFLFFKFKLTFIYLFTAVLGLRFCARAFSSCGKRGPLLIAVRGPLTIAASPVAEHRLQTCRLSNCGSRAQLLHGMWDPPRPGLKPVSPALTGRLSTTAPPGKPCLSFYFRKACPKMRVGYCSSLVQLVTCLLRSLYYSLVSGPPDLVNFIFFFFFH